MSNQHEEGFPSPSTPHPVALESKENLSDMLLSTLQTAEAHLVEKGLEADAALLTQTREHYHWYTGHLRKELQKGAEKGQSADDVLGHLGDGFNGPGARRELIMAGQINGDGGFVLYHDTGVLTNTIRDKSGYDDFIRMSEARGKQYAHKFLNYFPSSEGETDIYRALGVIESSETAHDLPAVLERVRQKLKTERKGDLLRVVAGTITQDSTYMRLPTNISGVFLEIEKENENVKSMRRQSLKLSFSPEFLKSALEIPATPKPGN